MSAMMAVAQQGEAILSLIAAPITEAEIGIAWLKVLTDAMMTTMNQRNGVGIAAPQVYISRRIIIVASRPNLRYPKAPEMAPIVMLNPQILEASAQMVLGEEGCLSVPEQRGQVARNEQILVQYLTLDGQQVQATFDGFPARIVQHEIDHLNGVLFTERLTD